MTNAMVNFKLLVSLYIMSTFTVFTVRINFKLQLNFYSSIPFNRHVAIININFFIL